MTRGLKYPIALAAGFTRFDQIVPWKWLNRTGDDSFHYFKRIRSTLTGAGFRTFHTTVSWGAPLAVRGEELAHEIDSILTLCGAQKVHVIAHSMGGLDARYAIGQMGYGRKICSLTTIATPHHGTPLASAVVARSRNGGQWVAYLHRTGVDLRGLHDLTPTACAERNARWAGVERDCGVAFRTWAGHTRFAVAFAPLKIGYLVLKYGFGLPENDGLVPLPSAKWNDAYFQGAVPWDHINQLGWWTADRFAAGDTSAAIFEASVRRFYSRIAAGLTVLEP